MYAVRPTSKFTKDLKREQKRGSKIELLAAVIKKLSEGKKLSPKHNDHALSGNYYGCRECHITSDWLLIYEIANEEIILYLTRTGTHSDLF